MLILLRYIALTLSISAYVFQSYDWLLTSFSVFLLTSALVSKKIVYRALALFFLLYLFIPFLNISNYRGTISIETLSIYCFIQFSCLWLINLTEKTAKNSKIDPLKITLNTTYLYRIHMIIVYLSLLYAYATVGIIILRQDLRFSIPPFIEYIIKSGLPVPLIWFYCSNFRINYRHIFGKILIPLLPSILIGSRGTFIMIIVAIFTSLFLISIGKDHYFLNKYKLLTSNLKKASIYLGILGLIVLYTGFYLRRDGINLTSSTEVLKQYQFTNSGLLVKSILPFYLNLRETVGITDRIIREDISNTYYPYSFFVAELMSFLPGKQIPPGRMLGVEIFGAQDYGLTPGIIGGLYLDYGFYKVILILSLVYFVVVLYNKGLFNTKYRLLFCFTIVQFFHLYHRGFLKIEYFTPYVVILIYLFTMSKRKRFIK